MVITDNRSDGDEFNSSGSNGDGEVEEHCKIMVEENPGTHRFWGLMLSFCVAYPKDGENLSQHAKLVWELYCDEERASSYIERTVQASPQDSHVHAANACVLWETEDESAALISIEREEAIKYSGSKAYFK
ncbi:hypothetical protein V6N13_081076 [Hibiscus sabdariffa]